MGNPLTFGQEIGLSVGGQALQTGLGLLTQNLSNRNSFKWGEKGAEADFGRQMRMYERQYQDRSPLNVVNQLKQAGLNKGLMFSGGASGVGGQAQGSTAPQNKMSFANAGMGGPNLAMTIAQIRNIEADTKVKESQVPNIGSQTDLNKAGLTKIQTDIENIKTDTALKQSQNQLNQIQQRSIEISNEFNAENNGLLLQRNIQDIRKLTAEANVSESTQQSLTELAKNNVQLSLSNILLNNSKIQLTEIEQSVMRQKIIEIANSINVSQGQLKINKETLKQALDIEKMRLSSGTIVNQVRGVSRIIWNALTGENQYSY